MCECKRGLSATCKREKGVRPALLVCGDTGEIVRTKARRPDTTGNMLRRIRKEGGGRNRVASSGFSAPARRYIAHHQDMRLARARHPSQ